MAEDTTGTDGAATADDIDISDAPPELADPGRQALQVERKARLDAEKARKAAEKEIEKLRSAAMSDQEKAIAAAKTDALAEANKAAAPRLVRAELRAAAAEAGVPKDALDGFLEYADLKRFVNDDGEPDSKAIAAAVKRLGGGSGRADYDGGSRGGAARPLDMSTLIRQKAGVL